MRIVIALGGNALSRADAPFDIAAQRSLIRRAVQPILALCRAHQVVLTHGNGPQVGHVAGLAAPGSTPPAFALDLVGAETDALIGYEIERELRAAAPDLATAVVLTMVEVAADDPAFTNPTKPIGPIYPEALGATLAHEHGWHTTVVPGGVRRVVASPLPLRILEASAIRTLVDTGHTVIACGGGGIPVTRDGATLRGAEAVVDKDHASALLAGVIGADALLLLTDVDGIYRDWPTPLADRIETITASALDGMSLAAGSMAPKARAAADFVRGGGVFAAIGRLEDLADIAERRAGTVIVAD